MAQHKARVIEKYAYVSAAQKVAYIIAYKLRVNGNYYVAADYSTEPAHKIIIACSADYRRMKLSHRL